MKLTPYVLIALWIVNPAESCSKLTHVAQAERFDDNGLRCYDNVKVHMCGGKCESSEISDWEFPFKKSHHPVCVYGARHLLMVRLRHCDTGVTPGTDVFRYVTAEDCRCKMCSSQKTNCEWLPPNSTLLDGLKKKTTKIDE
ncbi:thyrostimulin beta-5 subunit [Aricia agestis]|uniref:thyrostimulin beta-5 subunit n=1 Tax=Aricia agestis TaxID=91739 RepID=UPI001C202470|nr:thyrostimulin beta-5 subunit [Aricia agestis]